MYGWDSLLDEKYVEAKDEVHVGNYMGLIRKDMANMEDDVHDGISNEEDYSEETDDGEVLDAFWFSMLLFQSL